MTVQEFYKEVGGDHEAAKRIFSTDQMILRFLPKLASDPSCDHMMTAWKAGDRKGMFAALHSMKGVCANLGLMSLSEHAAELVELLRPGSAQMISDEELAAKIEAIRAQFHMTIEKIGQIA